MESNKHIREHLFAESVRQVDERHHYANEVSAERLSAADADGCHFAECLQDSAGVRLLNAVLVDTQITKSVDLVSELQRRIHKAMLLL